MKLSPLHTPPTKIRGRPSQTQAGGLIFERGEVHLSLGFIKMQNGAPEKGGVGGWCTEVLHVKVNP